MAPTTQKTERPAPPEQPRNLSEESFDCVWVQLAARPAPAPLRGAVLHDLDWRMRGRISRFVLEQVGALTLVPVNPMISFGGAAWKSALVAMAPPGAFSPEQFTQTVKGMKLSRVLVLCEDPGARTAIERAFKGAGVQGRIVEAEA